MAVASVILAISSAPFSCSVSSAVAHGCQLTTTPTACGTSCCPSSTFYTSSIYTSISTTCSSSDAGSKYTTIRFFASRTSVEEFNASTVFEKIVGRGTTSAATSKSDAFLPRRECGLSCVPSIASTDFLSYHISSHPRPETRFHQSRPSEENKNRRHMSPMTQSHFL